MSKLAVMVVQDGLNESWPSSSRNVLEFLWVLSKREADLAKHRDKVAVKGMEGRVVWTEIWGI